MRATRPTRAPRPRIAGALVAGLLLSGCAALTGDGSPGLSGLGNGDIAARAGDAVITVDELSDEVQAAVDAGALEQEGFTGSTQERRVQLQTFVLSNLLQIEMFIVAAEEDFGLTVSDDEVDAAVAAVIAEVGEEQLDEQLAANGQSRAAFRRGQLIGLLQTDVIDRLVEDDPVTDEDVEAALVERAAEFEQVSASHILVPTEEEALAAKARIEAGEAFADVAGEVSQDPGSAANGGSLGPTPRGTFVAPFEEAIWEPMATPGELLGPVETQFGFHLIVVDEFVVTPADEAEEIVRTDLQSTRGNDLFGFWLRQVFADAEPEVAARFGRWDRTQQAVVPEDPDAAQQ